MNNYESIIMNITEDILVAMELKNVTKQELSSWLNRPIGFVESMLAGNEEITVRMLTDIATDLDLDITIKLTHKQPVVTDGTGVVLKVGDIVESLYEEHKRCFVNDVYYPAVVIQLFPLVIVSLGADMRWESSICAANLIAVDTAEESILNQCLTRLEE